MKKVFIVLVFILLVSAGCGAVPETKVSEVTSSPAASASVTPEPTKSASATPEPKTSATVSIEPSPSASVTPEPTVSATVKPKTFPDKDYGNKINKDKWLYYLDLKNPIKSPDSEEPLYNIHRMKKDGSGDENLNIQSFRFDFAGDYLYADTNLTFGDFGHWVSYRYDLKGEGKKKIDYTDMRRFSSGGYLYFSLFNEPAFYTATTACTDVVKYIVKVPDDEKIRKKLGVDYEEVFVTVTKEKDGWVYFEFKVTDTGPMPHYTGKYRINLNSHEIKKVDDGKYE